jgi:hypothetical protein
MIDYLARVHKGTRRTATIFRSGVDRAGIDPAAP